MYRCSSSAMKTIIILALCAPVVFASRLPFTLSKRTDGRIVGGQNAAPKQFPYIVSIRYAASNSHLCGGSLLNENFAITAGHCCEGQTASDLVVVAGTNKLDQGGAKYPIRDYIIHPNFTHSADDNENDICLLRLDAKVKETDSIKFVALNRNTDVSSQPAEVAGWGSMKAGGKISNDLQWVPTTLVPHEDCIKAWGSHAPYPIRATHVCAFTKSGEGTCNGDSGGPLVVKDANGNPLLTGLVSWGDPCATGYPDMYTKVASYVDWIDSIINNYITCHHINLFKY